MWRADRERLGRVRTAVPGCHRWSRRPRRHVAASVAIVAIALGVTVVSCDDDGGDDPATPAPTPTATPDLSNALPADEAIDALAAVDPRLGSLFSSATTGDMRAFTELFNWQERPCGDPAAGEALCLAETPLGTPVESIEYGPVSGAAERELIDNYLRALAGDGLEPRLVLQSDTDPDIYFMFFTSDDTVVGEPPFGAMPTFGGVDVTVDLKQLAPVIRMEFLQEDWQPSHVADASGDGETILLYEP